MKLITVFITVSCAHFIKHYMTTCVRPCIYTYGPLVIFANVYFRHSKQTVVYENTKPITGLAFKTIGKNIILFVSTENVTLSINVSAKDRIQQVLFQHIQ